MMEQRYPVTIQEITDGDTLDVRVHLPFDLHKDITVRLLGLDTAETYGVDHDTLEYKTGKEHTQFVNDWIDAHDNFTVRFDGTGSFGRQLGELYAGSGESLNDALVAEYPSVEQ